MGVDAWALVIAMLSFAWGVFVWFSARKDAREARAEAQRSAEAADRSADAAMRSADAAERQIELATPPAIDFQFEQIREARYALRNIGTSTATGVTVDPEGFAIPDRLPAGFTLARDQAVEFLLLASWASPVPATAKVHCNELAEPLHVSVPPMR